MGFRFFINLKKKAKECSVIPTVGRCHWTKKSRVGFIILHSRLLTNTMQKDIKYTSTMQRENKNNY